MADLEAQFNAAMLEVYRHAKEGANYTASVFLQMLTADGGVRTAKTLINALRPSDGYTALWERGRLDLTVEAVVVGNDRWHPLFAPEEITRAQRRLDRYGYTPASN